MIAQPFEEAIIHQALACTGSCFQWCHSAKQWASFCSFLYPSVNIQFHIFIFDLSLTSSPVFPSMVYLKWKSFHSTWRIHFLCLLIIAIHSSIILTTFCFVLFHVTPPVFSFLPSHIWSMFLIHEALHSLPVFLFALVVFVSFPLHYETPSCLLLFFAIPHMSCCILHDYTSLIAEFLSLFQLLPINAHCTCCFLSLT